MASEQFPPWMSQQPPAGSPPPPPGAPWPASPPPVRGSPGLLTFVAVANLLFALACGCVSGVWAAGWSGLTSNPAEAAAWLDEHKDEMRVKISEELKKQSGSGKELTPQKRALVEQAVDPEMMREALLAVGTHPDAKLVAQATLFAGIAQAVLLIGSILLLMRKNAGRLLSILALAVFIGATVLAMLKFPSIGEQLSERVGAKIETLAAYKDLSPPEQKEIDTAFDGLPAALQGTVTVASVVSCIWPVLALLILLVSRGIKTACMRP